MDAFWDNSPSKAWFHLLYIRPLPGAEISAVRQGWDCEAGELCQRDIAPKWSSPGARVIPLLLAPGWHFLRSFCVCRALGWLRAESMPGLVQLMGKTWWLPVTQNILIISSGFFLRHTFLDDCSYLYLYFPKHSQYPSHFWLGNWNPTSFYLFICFLFCLMCLLWALLSLLHFVCQ